MNEQLVPLAREISGHLTRITFKDSDAQRTVWDDTTPDDLRHWFINAQGNRTAFAELDEYYDVLDDLCDLIIDTDGENIGDEIYTKDWSDSNNSSLLEWVSASLYRIEDVNEQLSQQSEANLIAAAQNETRAEKAGEIYQAMTERLAIEA